MLDPGVCTYLPTYLTYLVCDRFDRGVLWLLAGKLYRRAGRAVAKQLGDETGLGGNVWSWNTTCSFDSMSIFGISVTAKSGPQPIDVKVRQSGSRATGAQKKTQHLFQKESACVPKGKRQKGKRISFFFSFFSLFLFPSEDALGSPVGNRSR